MRISYSRFNTGVPKFHSELSGRLVKKEHLFQTSFTWANILYDIQAGGFRAKFYGPPVSVFGEASHGFTDIQHSD